jgi:predicted oxidoreductase
MQEVPKIKLSENLEISRLVHGQWRLSEWGLSADDLLSLIEGLVEIGITTFDHADIYGDYSCEQLFGDALKRNHALQDKIQVVTKCGIKLMSEKYPDRTIKSYDYSYAHIVATVESSLKKLNRDRIDLLLFHRPAPFFDPEEVAKAMDKLHDDGKVLNFGVSNFNPMQFEMLQKHTRHRLVTNQVEISPLHLQHFENGNIDFFLKERIHPMAWSPLAGGAIFRRENEASVRILDEIHRIMKETSDAVADQIIISWILKHPAGIVPVLGTRRLDRIMHAVRALNFKLSMEQWYRIYNASRGKDLA